MRFQIAPTVVVLSIAALLSATGNAPMLAQSTSGTAWEIPRCEKHREQGNRISSGSLNFLVPPKTHKAKVKDVDYFEYRIFWEVKGGRSMLSIGWEVNSPTNPGQSEVSQSFKYSRRPLKLPDGTVGVDVSGEIGAEGGEQLWRTVAVGAEAAHYWNASAESARYFDSIIDSACYIENK